MQVARDLLDSVAILIRAKEITFDEAVLKYSDDPGKNNGGFLINFNSGTIKFEVNELDPNVSFVVDKLDVGEISNPVPMQTDDGEDAFRLLYLRTRTLPHRANMEEDYNRIQFWAMGDKKSRSYKEWAQKKVRKTYIKIIDKYRNSCTFDNDWFPEQ